MKKITFLLLWIVAAANTLVAQQAYHRCSTMDYLQYQIQNDPNMVTRMQQIEQFTQNYIAANGNGASRSVITIPVVFHILYNTSTQNISDAQVQAQINQLNLDYARLNADAANTPSAFASLGANTNVQFCLAQRDPNGNATTGIIHKSTTNTSFTTDDKAKHSSTGGDDAWPASSYLNLWSCNLGGGLLGYAQFPGGAASTDGVVILYSSVGSVAKPGTAAPYNYGRTATHEVGHWLNLYHIWGDDNGACSGSDNVGDTPNQGSENYGCPTFPHTDACASTSPGVMFMNYMDYTDDGCMNIFTQGQSARMAALFVTGGARVGILSSLGCVAPTTTCSVASGLTTTAITSATATFSWTAVSGATSYKVQYRVVGTLTWSSATASTNSYNATGLTAGSNYEWQVQTVCTSGSSAFTSSTTFTTSSSTATCGAPAGLAVSAVTPTTTTVAWTAVSGAINYILQYRPTASSTWTSVTLSTNSYTISNLTPSTAYQWQVTTVCTSSSSSATAGTNFTTTASSACTDNYESNNTITTSRSIATNTDIFAQIGSTTDNDYFKFTTVAGATNVEVTLTNLPGDYDVRLYNSSGSQLGISQNGGTTSELIKRNTSSAATYYVRVYGYNGAYSTTQCYDLKVLTSGTAFRFADSEDDQAAEKTTLPQVPVKLYPNPAQNIVTVEYLSDADGKVEFSIYNLSGQRVVNSETNAAQGLNIQDINTSELMNGVYIFEIANNGILERNKFIIAR